MSVLGKFTVRQKRRGGKIPLRSAPPKDAPEKGKSGVAVGKAVLSEKEKFDLCTGLDCKFVEASPHPECYEQMFVEGGQVVRLSSVRHCKRWGPEKVAQEYREGELLEDVKFIAEGLDLTVPAGTVVKIFPWEEMEDFYVIEYEGDAFSVEKSKIKIVTGPQPLDVHVEAAKPAKVIEIADAIRRENPGISDESAYRMAWTTYCTDINPGYEGCKGGYPQAPPATSGKKVFAQYFPIDFGELYREWRGSAHFVEEGFKNVVEVEKSILGFLEESHPDHLETASEHDSLGHLVDQVIEEAVKDGFVLPGIVTIGKRVFAQDETPPPPTSQEGTVEVGDRFYDVEEGLHFVIAAVAGDEFSATWLTGVYSGIIFKGEVSVLLGEVKEGNIERTARTIFAQDGIERLGQKVFAQAEEEIKVGNKFSSLPGNFVIEGIGPSEFGDEVTIRYEESGAVAAMLMDDFIWAMEGGFVSRRGQKVFAQDMGEILEARIHWREVHDPAKSSPPPTWTSPTITKALGVKELETNLAMAVDSLLTYSVEIESVDAPPGVEVKELGEVGIQRLFQTAGEIEVGSYVTLVEDLDVSEIEDRGTMPVGVAVISKGTEVFVAEDRGDTVLVIGPFNSVFPLRKDQVSTNPPSYYHIEAQEKPKVGDTVVLTEHIEFLIPEQHRSTFGGMPSGTVRAGTEGVVVEDPGFTLFGVKFAPFDWPVPVPYGKAVKKATRVAWVAKEDLKAGDKVVLLEDIRSKGQLFQRKGTELVIADAEHAIIFGVPIVRAPDGEEFTVTLDQIGKIAQVPEGGLYQRWKGELVEEIVWPPDSATPEAAVTVPAGTVLTVTNETENHYTVWHPGHGAVPGLTDLTFLVKKDKIRRIAQVPEDEIKPPTPPSDRTPGGFSKNMSWEEVQEFELHSDLYDSIEEAQNDLSRFEMTHGVTPAIVFCYDEEAYAIVAERK